MSNSAQRRRRPMTIRRRFLLMTIGLSLGVGAVEVALRIAGVSHPVPYAPDPFCGSKLQPNFTGTWSKEGRARFHTNRVGFRDRDHSVAKPPKTLRIAVLGDSYIEALQVADDAIFARRLEQEFAEQPILDGVKVEVLSFGVSGWGTAQELLAARHYGWQYDPDIVVLAFLPGNDVRNNSRSLEPMQCRPFFSLVDGRLIPDESFLDDADYLMATKTSTRWKNAIINASRVIQLARAFRDRSSKSAQATEETSPPIEAGLAETGLAPPTTAEWNTAWSLTDRLIQQMADEVRQRGRRFVVMTVPSAIQVDPGSSRREEVQSYLKVSDLEYAERRMMALAEQHNFLHIPLAAAMRTFAEREQIYLHGFQNTQLGKGHWNEAGHREAAKLCAEALRTLNSQSAANSPGEF